MKKSLFIIPILALLAVSCSNTQEMVFENSAAERLDISREAAKEKLVKDGGLWAMEYFSNPEEPGYVMLFRFDKNGSVEVSANHKWIDNNFRQERSLWTINSDNGTVLSFNSYNPLFHIFSDPADITGPNQPINPDTDKPIDETGTGHEGDYEFMVMQDTDEDVMRLLGKKRGYNIYMYRLPESTNEKEYLEGIDAKVAVFNGKFKTYILTDAEGHEYEVTDMLKGIPSQFPRSVYDAEGNLVVEADPVSQTTSKFGIFTYKGFRFAEEYTVMAADDSEWEMPELFWAEDGTLVNTELGYSLAAPSAVENLNATTYKWNVDLTTMTGKVLEAYNAANDALVAELGTKNKLGTITIDWENDNNNKLSATIVTRIGTKLCRDYVSIKEKKGVNLTMTHVDANANGAKYNESVPKYGELKKVLCSKYTLTINDPMNPEVVHFALDSDPQSGFDIVLE